MGKLISKTLGVTEYVPDRRALTRPTMVLRVGLLETASKSAFCLLRNISADGVQIKPFTTICEGADVKLRVGDESPLEGSVAWAQNGLAGIKFSTTLCPSTLLRVRQMSPTQRRRASPRAEASGFAVLRTGGQEYAAKLCDISTSGAKIVTARSIAPSQTAVLLLPRLPGLKAFVRWTQDRDTGLLFETPIPIHILTNWLGDQTSVTIS